MSPQRERSVSSVPTKSDVDLSSVESYQRLPEKNGRSFKERIREQIIKRVMSRFGRGASLFVTLLLGEGTQAHILRQEHSTTIEWEKWHPRPLEASETELYQELVHAVGRRNAERMIPRQEIDERWLARVKQRTIEHQEPLMLIEGAELYGMCESDIRELLSRTVPAPTWRSSVDVFRITRERIPMTEHHLGQNSDGFCTFSPGNAPSKIVSTLDVMLQDGRYDVRNWYEQMIHEFSHAMSPGNASILNPHTRLVESVYLSRRVIEETRLRFPYVEGIYLDDPREMRAHKMDEYWAELGRVLVADSRPPFPGKTWERSMAELLTSRFVGDIPAEMTVQAVHDVERDVHMFVDHVSLVQPGFDWSHIHEDREHGLAVLTRQVEIFQLQEATIRFLPQGGLRSSTEQSLLDVDGMLLYRVARLPVGLSGHGRHENAIIHQAQEWMIDHVRMAQEPRLSQRSLPAFYQWQNFVSAMLTYRDEVAHPTERWHSRNLAETFAIAHETFKHFVEAARGLQEEDREILERACQAFLSAAAGEGRIPTDFARIMENLHSQTE